MITVSDILFVWFISMGSTGLLYLACIVSPVVARVCDKVGERAERFITKFADPILVMFGLDTDDDEGD